MIYPTTTLQSTATFKNSEGTLFDPTIVTCTVVSPSGVSTTYTYGTNPNITKTSTGVYVCVYDADAYGTWYERWYGENASGKITEEAVQVLAETH